MRLARWIAPIRGWLKINVDITTFMDLARSGMEVIARIEKGEVLAAIACLFDVLYSSPMVETMAVMNALH